MKITSLDRILLMAMGILAAYQVAVGIDGMEKIPTIAYTIGFGAFLLAGLLIIIVGLESLDSSAAIIVSAIIPLTISLGLVWQHLASWRTPYLVFVISGLLAILATRLLPIQKKLSNIIPALLAQCLAGTIIFLLPCILSANGSMNPGFVLVGLGGALTGLGGLLLLLLKANRPIVTREAILKSFPSLLLLTMICFVAGFRF